MAKPIYVVSYVTESDDRGVWGYFTEFPTDEHLTAFFKKKMPDEFILEDDEERRYIWWEVWELSKLSLPKPIPTVESI